MASLLILLMLTSPGAFAQAPAWQMAVATDHTGMLYHPQTTVTATDAAGNVYLAGVFTGTTSFGTTTLTTAAGDAEIFVAKWSPRSNGFIWAQRAGGTSSVGELTAIAVNGASVYISGYFYGRSSVSFGLPATATSSPGFFIAKLTDAGTTGSFSWVQHTSFPTTALAANSTGLYVAGAFLGTAVFGATTLTTGISDSDAFVAKLTDTGSGVAYAWAKQAGGSGDDYVTALAVNGSNVYLTGWFLGPTATFGAVTLTNTSSTVHGDRCDAFVAKLIDTGSTADFTWVQQVTGQGFDRVLALAVNGPSLYIAGYFGTSALSSAGSLGNTPATFGTTTLNNFGDYDAFVAKLTDAGSSGGFDWAQRAGGATMDSATAVLVRGNNVYVAGTFNSVQASFGATTLAKTSLPGLSKNVFVTKLVDNGNTSSYVWAQQGGDAGGGYANSLAASGNTFYVSGCIGPVASFGGQAITPSIAPGYTIGFLASLTDPTLLATTADKGALSFTLSPNPTRTTTTVQLPAVAGAPTATLTLTDALGRILRTETVDLPAGLRHELDLRGLAPGLYAVQVRAGSTSGTQRLVVE